MRSRDPMTVRDYLRVPRPVAAMAKDFPSGHRIAPDRHHRGQLLYATAGVMTVRTPHGSWAVPPRRAVWIPAHTEHESRMFGDVAMRTLYLRDDAAKGLPARCTVIEISPLLRELIVAATALPPRYPLGTRAERLIALLLDELREAATLPLDLPFPREARVARICTALLDRPGDTRSLARWAQLVGATPRHLARLFLRETGMRFTAWRTQARMMSALTRLATGERVTRVALELGYATPSAFGATFKRTFGRSPRAMLG